jgi:23S rRNA (cytidine1920-2'-O)/16S rRNA (cytidine1409-2'-O)-methyltransferase
MAGQVRVGTERIDKASRLLPTDADLKIAQKLKYVGRGGLKMENLLKDSALSVKGLHILDLGASTGGFTDCLLQYGAKYATCIDVGHGQLHYRLRTDKRVQNIEKTNIRNIKPSDIEGSPFSFIVMDLSFISLRKVLPAVWLFLEPQGKLVTLIKPQFECTKQEADLGKGIIRDSNIRKRVLDEIKGFAKSNLENSTLLLETEAHPKGTDGNQEFFLVWKKES